MAGPGGPRGPPEAPRADVTALILADHATLRRAFAMLDDALPDFRRNAPDELRARLAVQWLEWRYAHDSGAGMDTSDKDPQQYIAEHS